jgi:ribokinase
MAKLDILGLGSVAVDDLLHVEKYPPADSKMRVQQRERRCGGLAGAALIAAARLGARCAYAGVLGTDELSEFALQHLAAAGVEIGSVRRDEKARCIHSVVIVDQEANTRTIFYDTTGFVGAAMDWPPVESIKATKVLLVDHVRVEGMIRAAELARSAGCAVVADLESDRDPDFAELLRLVDHLIIPASFGRHLTGEKDSGRAARKLQSGSGIVVLTEGSAGCTYVESDGKIQRQPAYAVQATDTTGCGDVFHGAYAFGLARGLSLPERVKLAAAAAAVHAGGERGERVNFAQATQALLSHNGPPKNSP